MPEPAINLLRKVLHAAERGEPLPRDAAGWLVSRGQLYIAKAEALDPISLDVALGLGRPGRNGWWRQAARARRDGLLRELHRRHMGDLDAGEAAKRIAAMATSLARLNPTKADAATALLLAAVCTQIPIPGPKQLRVILRK